MKNLIGWSVISLLMFISHSTLADSLVSIGFERTNGDYGLNNDTDITTIPFDYQGSTNTWRFNLSIPYIHITGDGRIVPGSGGMMSNTNINTTIGPPGMQPASAVSTQSGLGDIITRVTHAYFPRSNRHVFYEASGEIKWGTASDRKNLGTGENDYAIKFNINYSIHHAQTFASLGYVFIGDTAQVDYNDILTASAGASFQISPDTFTGASYDYKQATTDGADDSHMIEIFLTKNIDRELSMSAYLLNGFSDSVADYGAGIRLTKSI